MMDHFSLAAFRIFSLSFNIYPMIYLGVNLFTFIQLGGGSVSWMCRLGSFQPLFTKIFFSLSLHSFLVLPLHIYSCIFWCPKNTPIYFLASLFCEPLHFSSSFISLFFKPHNLFWSVFKFSASFFLPAQIYFWVPLVNFLFWLLYFSTQIALWFF